jgi:maltooligosyltrehalose trehalohydrolase
LGGYGLDAIWADDFHHQIRVALTGEREGYYKDYSGSTADLAATLRQGWFYIGQRSGQLDVPRGMPADDLAPAHFVYCIQNHDQVGNRALGERLNHDIDPAAYRAASALLLLSPYTPLLWMGQEWAASTPFLFFTDHHTELGRLVTEGRRAEFAGFAAFGGEQVPDPQALDTFLRSKLRWQERTMPPHDGFMRLYHDLIALRRRLPALRERARDSFTAVPIGEHALALRRNGPALDDALLLIVNLRDPLRLAFDERAETSPPAGRRWALRFDSEEAPYGGEKQSTLAEAQALDMRGAGAVLLFADSPS